MNEQNVEIMHELIKKSRNFSSKGPNGQCCVLSWCYEAFAGAILNIISTDEIKMSFNSLLDRVKRCIEFEGDYFE